MKLKHFSLSQIFTFCTLMLIGIALTTTLKNDFFWDFANYHYYNAWAFLNHRLNYDIVPSSINTFQNPLIELPLYFYIQYFNNHISLIYAFQGVWTGLLLFTFYKIYSLFFSIKTLEEKILLILILSLSITGFATFHQLGSSTNEIPVAFFILWGLYILLKMIKFPDTQKWLRFLAAGLIMGIGLGLKQTVITYCLASGLTLIICYKYLKHPLKSILFFALGGLVGYLLTDGYFMYQRYILYGNPVFPFMNSIFHSSYFYNFNIRDARFIPPLNTFIVQPFLWNFVGHSISEVTYIDFRLPLLYAFLLTSLIYTFTTHKTSHYFKHYPLQTFLYLFCFLGFMIWITLFSILRYTVPLEVLFTLFLAPIFHYFLFKNKHIFVSSIICTCFIILMLLPIFDSGWNKRNSEDDVFLQVQQINIPDNTLIKLYNFPSAFVIPFLAKNNTIRAMGHMHYNCEYNKGYEFVDDGMFKIIRDNIEKNHKGPIIIIFVDNTLISDFSIEKEKEAILSCEQKRHSCAFNFCDTWPKTREIILSIPENFDCIQLKNNIESRIKICMPFELKDQILDTNNSKIGY